MYAVCQPGSPEPENSKTTLSNPGCEPARTASMNSPAARSGMWLLGSVDAPGRSGEGAESAACALRVTVVGAAVSVSVTVEAGACGGPSGVGLLVLQAPRSAELATAAHAASRRRRGGRAGCGRGFQ